MSGLERLIRESEWARVLDTEELDQVLRCSFDRHAQVGAHVLSCGEPASCWIGVISGMVKLSVSSLDGRAAALVGVTAGGWIGEASLVTPSKWRYDGVAVCSTRIACVPRHVFERLVATKLAFNHYLLARLQAQVWQSFGLLEASRLLDPTERVARCIASLFDGNDHRGSETFLRLSQEEIGLLSAVSRQRANTALHALGRAGLIRVAFRGVNVIDLGGLRGYQSPAPQQGGGVELSSTRSMPA